MSISHIESSTFVTATAGTTAALTVPAGATSGRFMLAVLKRNLNGESITPPAGWTLLDQGEVNTGWTGAYYRFAGSSEPASYTWTFSGSTLTRGDIHVYDGVHADDPISRHTLVHNTDNQTSYDSTPVEVEGGERLLTVVAARSSFTGTGVSWSTDAASDVERTDLSSARVSGFDISMASWDSGEHVLSGTYERTLTATTSIAHAHVWHIVLAATLPPFPEGPLNVVPELYLAGAWTSVKAHAYHRDAIAITRGRSDEGQQVDPSTCKLTLNNRDGRYSPRNPLSPLYGQITRNTPLRVKATDFGDAETFALMFSGDKFTTPDSAGVSVTGDIDIRVDVELLDWTGGRNLAGKYSLVGDQRSWAFYLFFGTLHLRWSEDGATSTDVASIGLDWPPGRWALRVTLDVDNGGGGVTLNWYWANTLDGPWTLFDTHTDAAGTSSLFDSTSDVEVGTTAISQAGIEGRLYGFELRNGIDGAVVANLPFPEDQPPSTDPFVDDHGNTWTPQESATVITLDSAVRFSGEVSQWPQKWDVSGQDVYAPIEASGILRRLGQGAAPISSTMHRGNTTRAVQPVAYWPCEDEQGATSIASGFEGKAPMRLTVPPDFASNTAFACSKALPVTTDGGPWRGTVGGYPATGQAQTRWLMQVPSGGATNGAAILRVETTGTVAKWEVSYLTTGGGSFLVRAWDEDGVNVYTSSTLTFSDPSNGALLYLSFELQNDGADVDWGLVQMVVGETTGEVHSGTVTGEQIQTVNAVTISPNGTFTGVAIGHLSVEKTITSFFDLLELVNAYLGERALTRIARLCAETDVALLALTSPDETVKMGPQSPGTLLDLVRECEVTDGGILYEPRGFYGLAYRSRHSLFNQAATLALDYETSGIAELEPVDDDQATRNDVTVTRKGGSSARAELTEGPLSVQPPPAGIGRYTDTPTINNLFDAELADHAQWRLHLGTVDESRYPKIGLVLESPRFTADAGLTDDAVTLDVGDRLTVDNLPAWLPPEPVSQIVQGFSETFTSFGWRVTVNCAPESPYAVGTWQDPADTPTTTTPRYDTNGSELQAAIDADDTALSVLTTAGASWTTDAADLPFDVMVGGERMTVTAIVNPGDPLGFVGVGAGDSDTDGLNVRPGLPTLVKVDDLVMMFASIRNTAATVNTPADWSELLNFGGTHAKVWGRIWDGVWDTPIITFAGGGAGDDTIVQACAFRGADIVLDAAASQANASQQNIPTPFLDVTPDGQLVVWAGWKQDDWTSVVHANSLASLINSRVGTAGNDASQVWAYRIFNQATDIGASQFTVTGGASAISRGATIALKRRPQLLTVTRSVNGVAKSHAAGAAVSLFRKSYWVL